MAGILGPRPYDATFSAHLMDHQKDMLQAFEDDDYHRLLDSVKRNEEEVALEPHNSRIIKQEKSWQDEAFDLLLQLDKSVLRSTLSNTLAYRLLTDLHDKLPNPSNTVPRPDPSIYVNCLAGADGKGIEVDQFEKFLKVIEVAAGVTTYPELGPWYGQARVIARVNTAYGVVLGTSPRDQDFFNGMNDGDEGRLVQSARTFCNFQRDHLVGKAAGLTHIALHPEVGLAMDPFKRCEDHEKMIPNLSPWLFKLVQLAAMSTFPARRFQLHQYILFRVTSLAQVAIGETLASLMCSSYLTTGGVNISQAGINIGKIGTIKSDDWDKAYNRFMVSKSYQSYTSNLKDHKAFLDARNEAARSRVERLKRQIERHNLREQIKSETAREEVMRSSIRAELGIVQSSLLHCKRHLRD